MAESADFLINRRSRRAFCCSFPAFLFPMAQKNGQQGEDVLEVEPLVCRVRVMVLRVVFCAVLFKKLGIILLHHGEVAKD